MRYESSLCDAGRQSTLRARDTKTLSRANRESAPVHLGRVRLACAGGCSLNDKSSFPNFSPTFGSRPVSIDGPGWLAQSHQSPRASLDGLRGVRLTLELEAPLLQQRLAPRGRVRYQPCNATRTRDVSDGPPQLTRNERLATARRAVRRVRSNRQLTQDDPDPRLTRYQDQPAHQRTPQPRAPMIDVDIDRQLGRPARARRPNQLAELAWEGLRGRGRDRPSEAALAVVRLQHGVANHFVRRLMHGGEFGEGPDRCEPGPAVGQVGELLPPERVLPGSDLLRADVQRQLECSMDQ